MHVRLLGVGAIGGVLLSLTSMCWADTSPQPAGASYHFTTPPALSKRTFDFTQTQDRTAFLKTIKDLPPQTLPALFKQVKPADLHALYADACVHQDGTFRPLKEQLNDPIIQAIMSQVQLDRVVTSHVHPAVKLSLFSVKANVKTLWAQVEPDFTKIIEGQPYNKVVTHPVFIEWIQTRPKADIAHIVGAVGAYTLPGTGATPKLTGAAKTFDTAVESWRKQYVSASALPKWF